MCKKVRYFLVIPKKYLTFASGYIKLRLNETTKNHEIYNQP